MPHGEILRGAYIRKNGLALLNGDPEQGFRPTQGAAMPTVYLDDDDVIKMKTTWKKVFFSIDINPPAKDIEEGKRRQEQRLRRTK